MQVLLAFHEIANVGRSDDIYQRSLCVECITKTKKLTEKLTFLIATDKERTVKLVRNKRDVIVTAIKHK